VQLIAREEDERGLRTLRHVHTDMREQVEAWEKDVVKVMM
jgi:hypothetical protein